VSVDGWVQLGAGYRVEVAEPRVVYDDMTVAQATGFPYTNWAAQRPSGISYRIALQREVYQSATACCMTSSWAAGSALHDYAVPAERVHVVGAGTHQAPRPVDRDWSTPRFLFMGFDWRRKNGDRLLDAFARVRQAYPSAELTLVGGHPAVDQPGVTGYGILRRDVPADAAVMRQLFEKATCFVMPSLFEPAGVVFTEAAAAGLPSIGGTVGGSRDFISDGGLVVEPTSVDELTAAMMRLSNPAEASAVGARAARRSPLFTWGAVAARLVNGLGLGDRAGLTSVPQLPLHLAV
jgi:glycosyltransferase involved in cell wall biosynthesis